MWQAIISSKLNQLYENNYLYETNFKFHETSLNIQNDGAHSTNVKIFNVYHLLNFPPILIKFVSKFIVWKVLYFKAQYLLRLHSPLIKRYHFMAENAIYVDILMQPNFWLRNLEVTLYVAQTRAMLALIIIIGYVDV